LVFDCHISHDVELGGAQVILGLDVLKEVNQVNETLLDAGVFTFCLAFGGANIPQSAFVSTNAVALLAGNSTVAGSDLYGNPIYGLKNFLTISAIDSTDFDDEGTAKTLFLMNSTGSSVSAGDFTNSNPGYIGFRFNKAGTDYYGWVHISSIAADYTSYRVFDWAYQANGISAGDGRPAATAVPEASSLALIAMGAGGLMCYRLRRRRNDHVESALTPGHE
jgi:hypothetical protein